MSSYLELYRQIDAQYRILNRLYSVEHLQHEQLKAHFRGIKAQAENTAGAISAGVLAVIPTLISLLGIEWGSAPAVVIYIIGAAIVGAAVWRICEARQSYEDAVSSVEQYSREPLEDSLDYHKAKISMQVERCALLDHVIVEAEAALGAADNEPEKARLRKRRDRAELAAKHCRDDAQDVVNRSSELKQAGKRTEEEHKSIVVWAKPLTDRAP